MKKLKIGLSTSSLEPSRNGGVIDGIGHYTKQLKKHLKQNAYSIEEYAFPRFMQSNSFVTSSSLKFPYPSYAIANYLSGSWGGRLHLDIDLFHSTDFKVVKMDVPVVATIWDAIPMTHPEWFSGKLKRKITPYLLRNSARYADRVIAASSHTANELVEHFKLPSERIDVIPWAVDDFWLQDDSSEEYKKTTLDKYNLRFDYILSVGTLQPRKNYGRIIDGYLKLPSFLRDKIKLVIVGKNGWCVDSLCEYLKRARGKGIIWLDNVTSDEELSVIYRNSKALVFPSLYEGFGVPVLEGFASNIPVITSNTTSLPEVSGDAALQVNPYSVDEISSAMRDVLLDSDLSKELVIKGQQRVQRFRWESTLEKTLNTYHKVT
ncbi:glycosyltransferase family 4 protein [Vibrio cholerae]|uniref:glycosyltransferase family 4 protein n=1 Tax=Vibrio cholerae TaxID=666 RepID=UPI003729D21A